MIKKFSVSEQQQQQKIIQPENNQYLSIDTNSYFFLLSNGK